MSSWFRGMGQRDGQEAPAQPAPPAQPAGTSWFSNPFNRQPEPPTNALTRGFNNARENTVGALGMGADDFSSSFCPKLSWEHRFIGWAICFGVGWILQIVSFGRIMTVITSGPTKLAVMYTIGNLLALVSTFFFAGPRRQCKKMKHPSRWIASLIYLGAMVATVAAVFVPAFPGQKIVILILIPLQWVSLVWYTLSYIPFGQRMAKRCCCKCLSYMNEDDGPPLG